MLMTENKDESSIFRMVEDKYQKSRDSIEGRFSIFNELEELYYGHIRNEDNPWKSNIHDPEVFARVERMTAHLAATKPRGNFIPREDSDTKSINVANELFKYQWDKPELEMQRRLARTVKGAGIFGISFGLLTWRWDRRKEKRITPEGVKEEYKQIWDDPYYEDLYIYDCYPDPSAMSIADMEYFIVNRYTTLAELKGTNATFMDGSKRYKNLKILEDKLKNKKNTAADVESYRNKVKSLQKLGEETKMKDRILVRTMYKRNRWVSICPEYKLVIEDHPNPYHHGDLPIHMMIDHDYPNELYGRGEIEPIKDLQKGLNSVVNQRTDNVTMSMYQMFKVKADSPYANTWKVAPMQKWVMEDPVNDVIPFSIQDVTGNTFDRTIAYYKDAISSTLGNYDMISRVNKNDRTATEAKLEAGEQNARLRQKESNMDNFIRRLANQWMQLNQQFVERNKIIRIVGRDAMEAFMKEESLVEEVPVIDPKTDLPMMDGMEPVTAMRPKMVDYKGEERQKFIPDKSGEFGFFVLEPEDIKGSYDFVVEMGSTVNVDNQAELQKANSALEAGLKLKPLLQQEGIDLKLAPLAEKYFMKLGFRSMEDILQPMPQQPMQQPMPQQMI